MTTRLRVLPVPPLTRGECREWQLRCRLTACRYHLGDGANPCALTLADAGPMTLQEIANAMGVTDSAAHQLERSALAKVARIGQRMRELRVDSGDRTVWPEWSE